MARSFSTRDKFTSPQLQPNQPETELKKFAEGRINLGMVTMIDPENIPLSAVQFLKNAVVRYDRTSRRPGSSLYTIDAADNQPVLKVAYIKLQNSARYTLRFTPSSVFLLVNGSWIPFHITVPFGGGIKDRIEIADIFNQIVFSNNGENAIQTIDFNAETISRLGNAPNYRFVTGFFNRVVGFARRGSSEVEVGWSGENNPQEWNPLVDETAGSSPLSDTPDDLSDYIKGGFAFSNMMIVLREKSIWLANKQPIPQNPFYFYAAVPGIGCDCPYSAQIINNGLAWLDTRSGTVYAYSPGSQPEAIGAPIEKSLIAQISDPSSVFAAYSSRNKEYTVYTPLNDDAETVGAWTYNFQSKAWTYGEYLRLASVDDPEASASGIRISDLAGEIGDLVGTIEDLSPINNTPIRLYGFQDGRIGLEDVNANSDIENIYDTQIVSKVFRLAEFDTNIAKVVIEYNATDDSSITIEYSKSGGEDDDWILGKIITPTIFGKPVNLIFRRVIRCRRFAWRITTRNAKFAIRSYEVHVYQAGESKGS